MKMLADRNIKHLFYLVLTLTVGFSLLSAVLLAADGQHAARYLPAAFACMGLLVLTVMYCYFHKQHQTMARAIEQLHSFLAGDSTARIECDDEGELNRLFHEVNSLAAILNAHAENEGRAKRFMKDTLSDISHQLKTPLAALNIYNGILQQQADPDTVREFTALSEQELDRIQTLVHNLLTITKLDAGTIVLNKSEHNLSDLMAEVKRRFAVQAQQQNTMLSYSGEDDISLSCDAHWLGEAIGNLVKNALDHTKAGDTITSHGAPLRRSFRSRCGTAAAASIRRTCRTSSNVFTAAASPRIHRASGWACHLQKPSLKRITAPSRWTAPWAAARFLRSTC